ncbi:MAG: hypothetical protein Q7T18_03760 [Sedimentisphaerales bacterium]|nr:hypothetical protein [Sedimentisphaerales bacterium]
MMNDKEIKKLLKDPRAYYVLVPAVLAMWPLWVAVVALPAAQTAWQTEKDVYEQVEKAIAQIQQFDPGRFISEPNQGKAAVFSYPGAVEQVARSCQIPASEYKLQSSAAVKSKEGQQTQDATVTLKQVDVVTFTKFLSTMQLRWADVQCVSLKLSKLKGAPDLWKVDMKFKYYF